MLYFITLDIKYKWREQRLSNEVNHNQTVINQQIMHCIDVKLACLRLMIA